MRPAVLLVLALLFPSSGSARCLSYEPTSVSLVGTLTSRAFPGPPNYANIAEGDRAETAVILVLEAPFCLTGDPSSQLNTESLTGITEVQLSGDLAQALQRIGERVRVTGSLSGGISGHHRTRVLLQVSELEAA